MCHCRQRVVPLGWWCITICGPKLERFIIKLSVLKRIWLLIVVVMTSTITHLVIEIRHGEIITGLLIVVIPLNSKTAISRYGIAPKCLGC